VSHTAWNEAAEYRFLDEALRQPDGDRTPLQRRALVAVELLSQAWLSWQPDTAFLSAVVALEALLGEPGDSTKKLRIARLVSYFICGWLEGSYAAGGRPACPLLALPLMASGQPGTELKRLMSDVKEGAFTPCTQFFGVLSCTTIATRSSTAATWVLLLTRKAMRPGSSPHGSCGQCSGGSPSIRLLTSQTWTTRSRRSPRRHGRQSECPPSHGGSRLSCFFCACCCRPELPVRLQVTGQGRSSTS